MKKLRLLLILPLLFICINNVHGADDNTIKFVTQVSRGYQGGATINLGGSGVGHFYDIKLSGRRALCMDLGKTLKVGLPFKLAYTIPAADGAMTPQQQVMAKAYYYAMSHESDMMSVLTAQIVVWIGGATSPDTLYEMVIRGFRDYDTKFNTFAANNTDIVTDAKRHVDGILATSIPANSKIYVWEHATNPSAYQRLLTDLKGDPDEDDKEDACKIVNINQLPACTGTAKYNIGNIYETATGQCYNGYDKKVKNKRSIYGQNERDYGSYCRMYCLKQFQEILPGNIAKAIDVGRYIVWPNNNRTTNTYKINANLASYPMITTLAKSCRISVDKAALVSEYNVQKNKMNSLMRQDSSAANQWFVDKCSGLEQDYNNKAAAATQACSNIPACVSSGRMINKTWVPMMDCSAHDAAQAQCNSANEARDAAQKKMNVCKDYGTAHTSAKNIINDYNSCVTADASMSLSYSLNGARSEYNDPEYGGSFDLTETYTNSTCDNCKSNLGSIKDRDPRYVDSSYLRNLATSIESRKIVATLTKKYDMAEYNGTYYYYVNKDNNKFVNSNAGLSNYTTVGFSNMPISYNSDPKKKYSLNIRINDVSGDASVFSAEISSNNYACYYKVKKTPDSCVCPEGTMHAGESLSAYLVNSGLTCSDAQLEYCDKPNDLDKYCVDISGNVHIYNSSSGRSYTDFLDQECPEGGTPGLVCPNDPSMDLSSCVNTGMTYNKCVDTFCNGNKNWVCPAGTNEGMDLTSCVLPMIVKGYSEADAYEYCKDVTCPYGGIKIIYRVIDLTNPFPSKDADATVTQSNLRVGMFNDELKGRYPGSNWNSTRVVRTKILENRRVDGDRVYNKTPMYTFIVNSQNIKAIRAYNNTQHDSYSDFKLKCLINNSSACKSEFVHNRTYGLVGGTCQNVSKGNFYTCDD